MRRSYVISGMTCAGCAGSITKKLLGLRGVQEAKVDFYTGMAELQIEGNVPLQLLMDSLAPKYGIADAENVRLPFQEEVPRSKLQQLRPLFLIFAYLLVAVLLMNYENWNAREAMLDFMGLFFLVFSFFKFLDVKGFSKGFARYDPLAKTVPLYGWVYPFLELVLGLLFLLRIQLSGGLIATIILLGITTFGVVKVLFQRQRIQCACLGSVLNLPMTEATLIENAMMLVMAVVMLFQ